MTWMWLDDENKQIVFKNDKVDYEKNKILITNGGNLTDIRNNKLFDLNSTTSNNILDIYYTFGVEAARKAIIKELYLTIRGGAGTDVNYQHIILLADFITHNGILTAINRHGLNKLDVGVLTKCSFEETLDLFLNAGIFNEKDNIKSVSSSLIMGKTPEVGTGNFEIIFDINKLVDSEFDKEFDVNYNKQIQKEHILDEIMKDNNTDYII